MAKDAVEKLAKDIERVMKATVTAAGKVPEGKRMKQAQAGKAHPLWVMGHLAFSFDIIVDVMALGNAPQLPGDYFKKFAPTNAGGGPITANAADYPAWNDVVAGYEKAGASVVAHVRNLDDSDLPGGPKGKPPEAFKEFFAVLGTTLTSMVDHDSFHRGQMALLAALD